MEDEISRSRKDRLLVSMFQRQVLTQCEYVLFAYDKIRRGDQETSVFFWIQSLLSAAANISKALWGERGRLAKEREPLRRSIGVGKDSPIKNTLVRNHFEHLDQRLDEWREEKAAFYMDQTVEPLDDIAVADVTNRRSIFRAFDPEEHVAVFWGDTFNLLEIASEVERILPRLEAEVAKGFRP